MMYDKVKKYSRLDKSTLRFNDSGGEMIAYVPSSFFDSTTGYATFEGEFIKLLGIFNYSIFDSKKKSITGLGTFKVPTIILTKPSSFERKELTLTKDSKPREYYVLRYIKEDPIIQDTRIAKDISNVELFFNLLISGNLPNTIPYNELHNLFIQNAEINNVNYPASNHVIGIIIRELCKSIDDLQKPYVLSEMNSTMTNYRMVSIKDNPKYTSAFTALTSENINASIPMAIMNKTPIDAPLEKLLIETALAGDPRYALSLLLESASFATT